MMLDQRVHLRQRPRRRLHRVTPELSQRLDAQVAINEHVPRFFGHHDYWHLLALLGQRGQQPPASPRIADAQIGVPQLELMELQVHELTLLGMAARVPSRLARRRGDVWRIPLPFRVLASASRLARGSPGLPPIPQGLQRLATPSRLAPGPRALPPAAPGPAPRAARPAGPSPASSPSAAPDRSQGAACAMHGPRVDAAHAGTRPSHRSAAGRPLAHRARTSGDTPNTGASSARPDDRPGDRPVLPAHARGPGWVIFGEQTRVYSRERRSARRDAETSDECGQPIACFAASVGASTPSGWGSEWAWPPFHLLCRSACAGSVSTRVARPDRAWRRLVGGACGRHHLGRPNRLPMFTVSRSAPLVSGFGPMK